MDIVKLTRRHAVKIGYGLLYGSLLFAGVANGAVFVSSKPGPAITAREAYTSSEPSWYCVAATVSNAGNPVKKKRAVAFWVKRDALKGISEDGFADKLGKNEEMYKCDLKIRDPEKGKMVNADL